MNMSGISSIRIDADRARRWLANPGRVVAAMLGIAALLSLTMALLSAINDHPDRWVGPPDEYLHRSAARYYIDHWLPPKVGNAATLDSYSRDYGYSYLNDTDPVYFFAGKFARLVAIFITRDDVAFRVFNVLLLAVLAGICAWRPRSWLVFAPLLLSPQIWYIFSYFNGDAFPLFVSVLLAYQATEPRSLFNRYLDAPGVVDRFPGILLAGALVSLVALSKKNYYVFLAFLPVVISLARLGNIFAAGIATAAIISAAAYLKWLILGPREIIILVIAYALVAFVAIMGDPLARAARLRTVLKCALFAGVAAALVLPRFWIDSDIQGSLAQKNAAMGTVQEQLATPDYKPSKIFSDDPQTFRGIGLRARGVGLAELFRAPWNWHKAIFLSSTGHYGWLEYRSPTPYYVLLGAAYAILILAIAWRVARSRDIRAWSSFAMLLLFSALCVGISLWQAWENDYQAQGRYLFPIVAILGVFLQSVRRHLNAKWMLGISSACFLLSAYSFVFTGLWDIPKRF